MAIQKFFESINQGILVLLAIFWAVGILLPWSYIGGWLSYISGWREYISTEIDAAFSSGFLFV
jgi:hypothetical protein